MGDRLVFMKSSVTHGRSFCAAGVTLYTGETGGSVSLAGGRTTRSSLFNGERFVDMTIFFGGWCFIYGGYELQNPHPTLAVLSYIVGGLFILASIFARDVADRIGKILRIGIPLWLLAFISLIAISYQRWQAPPSMPVVATSSEDWNQTAGHHSGPLGPILAAEFMWEFSKLPNCTVKVTAFDPEKSQLAITFTRLLTYGHTVRQAGRPICKVDTADPPPADPVQKNRIKGVVIHWNPDYPQGEGVAKWFDESGFIVGSSYRLPKDSPKNLIWIDIGPESPWK